VTTDETITEKMPAVRDGHTGELAIIPPEADEQWLASLHDDGQPLTDLRTEHYTEQVIAALHGDPAVFTLDAFTQHAIGGVCRAFELKARGIRAGWDSETIAKRAAVLLMAEPTAGTPMRCPCGGCTRETTITSSEPPGWKLSRAHTGPCGAIHLPLTGDIDWDVAGRQDIMCPPCWKAQPKHTTKAAPVKAAVKAKPAAAGTRRRRTSTARKTTPSSAPPDAA
jgi:hypothetical protein